jgi:pimeloyl-ACP methyl ester carboxylesterase
MTVSLPTVFIPGLALSPRLYAEQLPAAWRLGPVCVADHTRDDSMASIARRVLTSAPARFALVGLSMGGYVAFEIMRQAPERVTRLALLDTTARPDTIEQTARRKELIAMAQNGRFSEVPDALFPKLVHKEHTSDEQLRGLVRVMAVETGAEAFVRQQNAIMTRPDSRPILGAIACPALVVVGDGDELTPPDVAREIASGIRGARLAIVPDSGHLSTLEQPGHVARLLGDWLQG